METFERVRFETPYNELPLVAQSASADIKLTEWLESNRSLALEKLEIAGAILFRGFEVANEKDFEEVVKAIMPNPLEYLYRSTPRTQVGDRIYTATEYPPSHNIPLHNESAYQRTWPLRLVFCCIQPAEAGGETPLADSVKVTERIDPGIRNEFARRGVMYIRNYETGPDLGWQTVFQTTDRREAERYCLAHDIKYEWKSRDSLRTRQVCQGMATHPTRGVRIWFNQAHLFHISSLGERTRKALLQIYREEDLPRNAYYGDGAAIPDDALDHIRDAYQSQTVTFPWMKGDVLLVDNMLVAHGRASYEGKRKVLAAMSDEHGEPDSWGRFNGASHGTRNQSSLPTIR